MCGPRLLNLLSPCEHAPPPPAGLSNVSRVLAPVRLRFDSLTYTSFDYFFLLDWFVTGHLHGEIFIWRDPANLVRPNSLPVCTRLHWHAHAGQCSRANCFFPISSHSCAHCCPLIAVTSLAVSGDKLQLYSGGKEGVLVLWRVSTGEHTYLPRLGEEVLSIVDG